MNSRPTEGAPHATAARRHRFARSGRARPGRSGRRGTQLVHLRRRLGGTAGTQPRRRHLLQTVGGDCTLPAAIQQADFNCGSRPGDTTTTTIDISIGSGPVTISPAVGSGSPGSSARSSSTAPRNRATPGGPIVQLDGTSHAPEQHRPASSMLTSCTCPSSIRGFVINRFIGSGIGLGHGGPFTVAEQLHRHQRRRHDGRPNGDSGIDIAWARIRAHRWHLRVGPQPHLGQHPLRRPAADEQPRRTPSRATTSART